MQESGSVFSAAVSKMQAGKQLQCVLAERLKMVFHVNYTEEIGMIVSYTILLKVMHRIIKIFKNHSH